MVDSQYKWMAVLTHDERLKTTLSSLSLKQKSRTHFFKFIEQLNDFLISYLSLENKLPQIIVVDSFLLTETVVKSTIVRLLKIVKEINETCLNTTKSDFNYSPLIAVCNPSKNILDEFKKDACIQIRQSSSLILSSHFCSSLPKLNCRYCSRFESIEQTLNIDDRSINLPLAFLNNSNEISGLLKNTNSHVFKSFGLTRTKATVSSIQPEPPQSPLADIELNINGHQLFIEDKFLTFKKQSIAITKIEHKILVKLGEATIIEAIVSPEDISVLVWNNPLFVSRLDVHLTKLRQKLRSLDINIERVKSGYRLRF